MTLKSDAKIEEKLTSGSKNDMKNSMNVNASSANLKIWTLMCYFCRKYIMFEPKKGREVICHNIEELCKIWGGTDLYFKNWREEFGEFRPSTRKSQNLHFIGLLLTKVYNVLAKKLQSSYVSWHWMWFEKWHKEFA